MRWFVTGCAGFIGSTLTDKLLLRGDSVVGYDNLSTGRPEFLTPAKTHAGFTLVHGDTLNEKLLKESMSGCDAVLHLAANADVRFGVLNTRKDLEQNTFATYNVLEAMRSNGIRRIGFPSTGSVYGEPKIFPTPEECPFPLQTSLYGASKVAAEALIQAYCEGFGFEGFIFRFVSIVGERYTHGHVVDFCRSLRSDPSRIEILGNGKQRKSYLYIDDCIEAVFLALEKAPDKVNIFNLGTHEYCSVDESLSWICEELGVNPVRNYRGGDRGWVGDSPFIFLDTSKIRALGWSPRKTIKDGILATVRYLQGNPWLTALNRT